MGAVLIGITAVVLSLDPSCSSDLRQDIPNLERLVVENAERDARVALKRGEEHFLGVAIFVVETPGISRRFAECPALRDRTRFICGTSDLIYGEHHLRLIRRAKSYAARYNQVVERNVKGQLSRECPAL
jgi:hypothetical protein